MNPINKKPAVQTDNMFYGVNVNDKQAVLKEYNRLKKKHRNMTLLVIVVLIVLGVFIFDFVRVNSFDGKPIIATSKKVENGTLFSGLGYKVLYCDDGKKYIGSVLYNSCDEPGMQSFSHVVYQLLIDYGEKKKILDKDNLSSLNINSIEFDENNDNDGGDYLVDLTYVCKDSNTKCFRFNKEYNDYSSIKVYVRLNKFNEIYDVVTFKNSGAYYDTLKEDYTNKVREYLKENNLLVEDNLKYFTFDLAENNGKYKFRGITYADSYLVKIGYTCLDNSNTCVNAFDKKDYEGDFSNMSFYASMFLDSENNVVLVGPREYLDME